jgi:hypothetical protein
MFGLNLGLGLWIPDATLPAPSYTPSADFSDARNSQYVPLIAFSG